MRFLLHNDTLLISVSQISHVQDDHGTTRIYFLKSGQVSQVPIEWSAERLAKRMNSRFKNGHMFLRVYQAGHEPRNDEDYEE